ncbi:hypothetical protein [Oryzihumus leptocrescens]|nr:hypothetical protein [Oryzihumus leptocrescens]
MESTVLVILNDGKYEEFEIPAEHQSVAWSMENGRLKIQAFKKKDDGTYVGGLILAEFSSGSWLGVRRVNYPS